MLFSDVDIATFCCHLLLSMILLLMLLFLYLNYVALAAVKDKIDVAIARLCRCGHYCCEYS